MWITRLYFDYDLTKGETHREMAEQNIYHVIVMYIIMKSYMFVHVLVGCSVYFVEFSAGMLT
jgi:hypothetical protein